MPRSEPLRVAVLGAGLIGIDLVTKIQRSPALSCELVVGRTEETRGLRHAAALGCATAAGGVDALVAGREPFDVVFDATNATAHAEHWARLEPLGTLLVDLTPSRVGHMVVPTVNGADALLHRNVNLVSCGGQASVPVLHALARLCRPRYPEYVEVVTTAASVSVGRATRLNLDEYIATTETAVRTFTGVADVKAIVNLSPARPPAPFRVAMSLVVPGADEDTVAAHVEAAAAEVRRHTPGYRVTACTVTDERIFVAVEVTAAGDRIPRYAGNLDIINAAAVLIAERYAARRPRAGATEELS
ncbi:acetylating acetaldehyde dehydrogenase [Streptomyces chumphonensis]|uniref:Acetaldehyde dehydrogenase n=1 Tax=Streptomyces chumphonensis TaxID=1214925 RepID=A0A927EW10_9ACTN|nr:acetaldehyde dehydrogenase (acetylating) [Streptomyces chumphonensis]MBD3930611.1 acetaldehyde dehydrogenase (acetylating) [Streptomyces chumphonensis]